MGIVSAFEDHDWECRNDRSAADPWFWEVYRDRILVGYLRSSKSGFLDADQHYDAYDVNNNQLNDSTSDLRPIQSPYTNALMLINMAADGGTARPAEGRWT